MYQKQGGFQKQRGFTIVELLIVIVVIGILAAITVVAYNGVQARAKLAKKESASAQIQKAFSMNLIEFDEYPTSADDIKSMIGSGLAKDTLALDSTTAEDDCWRTRSITKEQYCVASSWEYDEYGGYGQYTIVYWHDVDRRWLAFTGEPEGHNYTKDLGSEEYPVVITQ